MTTLLPTPDPNDARSIELHKRAVFSAYSGLFDVIDEALADSIPKANDFFKLFDGPVDLAVHAAITRYVTKLALGAKDVSAQDEDGPDYELQRVANCGLCLRLPNCEIRILKTTADGIPKANSTARSRFYSSNQLQLGLNGAEAANPISAANLSLVLLWDMDDSRSYSGMEIACPRGERPDGSVDCFWIAPWRRGEGTIARKASPKGLDSDLDEIKPIDARKTATS